MLSLLEILDVAILGSLVTLVGVNLKLLSEVKAMRVWITEHQRRLDELERRT